MDKDLVIGIDASTTAIKAIVWDRDGYPVGEGRTEIPLLQPRAVWHEQVAGDWWQGLCKSLRIAVGGLDRERLVGLCICPQRETFVPVDSAGEALRNALLRMDVRAQALMPVLECHFGSQSFHEITGKPLSGNLTVLKLAWLRENEPHIYRNTSKFLDVAAYLNFRLTGEYATGMGIADPTGLVDMNAGTWSSEILEYLGLTPDKMPPAYPAGTVIGTVVEKAARECNLPAGLTVVSGLGDGQAGGLGVNVTRPGDCYLSLGTSVVSGTYTPDYVTDPSFRTMYAGIPSAYSLETVILGGTYTLDWFLDHFSGGLTIPQLENEVSDMSPGSGGLLLVPYWNSALNPYWDPKASGMVLGWRGYHRPAHLFQAILEGIAFELKLHFEGVERAINQRIERLVVMGGGSKSDVWCQMVADVTGKTLHRAETAEATALGAGILAAYGAGWFRDIHQAASRMGGKATYQFQPDPRYHQKYNRLYQEIYRHLFPTIRTLMDRLTGIMMEAEGEPPAELDNPLNSRL